MLHKHVQVVSSCIGNGCNNLVNPVCSLFFNLCILFFRRTSSLLLTVAETSRPDVLIRLFIWASSLRVRRLTGGPFGCQHAQTQQISLVAGSPHQNPIQFQTPSCRHFTTASASPVAASQPPLPSPPMATAARALVAARPARPLLPSRRLPSSSSIRPPRQRGGVGSVRCMARRPDSSYSPLRSGQGGDRAPTEMAPLFPGCDYEHWLIVMDKPGGEGATKQQMIDCYIQTLAQVVGR